MEQDATPTFCKARKVPYALREKVENELNRLEANGIIEPVKFSNWAAPVVPVLKPDGSIRICGDYKLTVNKAAKLDPYPLPKIEDLFARLAGGKKFTKLDIAHAYQQIPLDEESKDSVTINTHKGLFRYNRLPFGVHSAPAIFQRAMEGLLRDIPSTVVYIDDILVTGETEEEHLQNIDKVLTRLGEENLILKKGKVSVSTGQGGIPWAFDLSKWFRTNRDQGQSHQRSPSASECTTVALISRNGELLWQVHQGRIEQSSTTVSVTSKEDPMEMGRWSRGTHS